MSTEKKSFSDGKAGREEEPGGEAKCMKNNGWRAVSLAREEATSSKNIFLMEIDFIGCIS